MKKQKIKIMKTTIPTTTGSTMEEISRMNKITITSSRNRMVNTRVTLKIIKREIIKERVKEAANKKRPPKTLGNQTTHP